MKTNIPTQSELIMINDSYSEKLAEKFSPSKANESEHSAPNLDPIKRRKFLGIGLLGMAGLSLPFTSRGDGNNSVEKFVKNVIATETELYKKQSDSFETKIKLIEKAWAEKDYRMVRSLSDSLRNTGIQAQIEDEDPGKPLVGSGQFGTVSTLPAAWKAWANGWKYYKVIGLEEKAGIKRTAEPVEVLLAFKSEQVTSLAMEIRVAEISNGQIKEVTSQVYGVVRRGTERLCKVMFLADNQGGEKRNYLVFYGNPDAELPEYTSDLEVSGEGYHLKIENQYFIASLSKQTGQLERMLIKREHG
ncbi:MAG TPA: hypothetical protein PLT16_10505, partial [Daejeonella sp.]|nr:hypothetical protein [Daejeonella sp.]